MTTNADTLAAAANGALVANLPLFGVTPMTTTEPAGMPGQGLGAATPPPANGDKLAAAAAAATPPSDSASSDDDSGDSDSSDGASATPKMGDSKSAKGPKSFTHGKVHNPVMFNIHMANAIKSVRGMSTPMGFTVHVGGTQTKDSTSGLAQRDSRIASMKIANKSSGADLTVQFKDGVPAYAVRANGNTLQIAISRSSSDDSDSSQKKSAKADKHHPRNSSKHSNH